MVAGPSGATCRAWPGHRAGVSAVRSTVETAARIHIPALTLYAFSEENWKKRPKSEVGFLMGLLSRYLKAEVPTLNKNNIRLEYIGRQHELPEDVQERMEWAREATSRNSGMVLTLALNYSARSELVDAFRSMVNAAAQNGGIEHLHIDEDMVGRHLYTRNLPDPDLVVRTSGEMRLSNFLLWQLAYAEIYVTPTLWPDFRGVHLLEGIAEYQKRERRYGGLNHPESNHGDGHAAVETFRLLPRNLKPQWTRRTQRKALCFSVSSVVKFLNSCKDRNGTLTLDRKHFPC